MLSQVQLHQYIIILLILKNLVLLLARNRVAI